MAPDHDDNVESCADQKPDHDSPISKSYHAENIEKLKDDELNFLAEELSGDDLVEFTRGSALKKLATIMMKKPGMIRLAKELL